MSALEPEIDHANVSEILASTVCYFQEGSAILDVSAIVQEEYAHKDSVFTVVWLLLQPGAVIFNLMISV